MSLNTAASTCSCSLILHTHFGRHSLSLSLHGPHTDIRTKVCQRQHAALHMHKATYGRRFPPVLVMSVSAQSSTPVQLNEELIIVAARTVDIDTVRVVGVTCVRKSSCKHQQLHFVTLQHVLLQQTPSGRGLKITMNFVYYTYSQTQPYFTY